MNPLLPAIPFLPMSFPGYHFIMGQLYHPFRGTALRDYPQDPDYEYNTQLIMQHFEITFPPLVHERMRIISLTNETTVHVRIIRPIPNICVIFLSTIIDPAPFINRLYIRRVYGCQISQTTIIYHHQLGYGVAQGIRRIVGGTVELLVAFRIRHHIGSPIVWAYLWSHRSYVRLDALVSMAINNGGPNAPHFRMVPTDLVSETVVVRDDGQPRRLTM
ncbi:hypothetical protein ONZ45_g15530 [Pleurotus djamor]|nr:hypothetical protein ONZ45_g15530 [Pleurotus djamor]